jgi:oligopeptide transport system permease protein
VTRVVVASLVLLAALAAGAAGANLVDDGPVRDVLLGLRGSGTVALGASVVAVLLGVGYGAVAGFLSGRAQAVVLRVLDVLGALPYTLFVVTLMVVVRAARPELPTAAAELLDARALLVLALGGVEWLTLARVMRARTTALRGRPFVLASRRAGAGLGQVLRIHLVPHTYGPLLASASTALPLTLQAECFLSFLGFGIEAPHLSLGGLIAAGALRMSVDPFALLLPCGVLVVTLLALRVVADHLEEGLARESRGRA